MPSENLTETNFNDVATLPCEFCDILNLKITDNVVLFPENLTRFTRSLEQFNEVQIIQGGLIKTVHLNGSYFSPLFFKQ